MKLSILISIALLVTGCATSPLGSDPTPKPTEAKAPKPAPPSRELGSLWSADSAWNSIYSAEPPYLVGDFITIKIDETLKGRILAKLEKIAPQKLEEKKKDPEPVKEGSKDAKDGAVADAKPAEPVPAPAASSGPGKGLPVEESKTIRAVIHDISPRGIYTISASETLRFGAREPFVIIEGKIRVKDIDAQDTVAAESLQNFRLEVKKTASEYAGRT